MSKNYYNILTFLIGIVCLAGLLTFVIGFIELDFILIAIGFCGMVQCCLIEVFLNMTKDITEIRDRSYDIIDRLEKLIHNKNI